MYHCLFFFIFLSHINKYNFDPSGILFSLSFAIFLEYIFSYILGPLFSSYNYTFLVSFSYCLYVTLWLYACNSFYFPRVDFTTHSSFPFLLLFCTIFTFHQIPKFTLSSVFTFPFFVTPFCCSLASACVFWAFMVHRYLSAAQWSSLTLSVSTL